MAVRDIFKFSRKTFFNPSGWFDLNQFVFQNRLIYTTIRDMFGKPQVEYTESFEAAMERLGLTELDVKFGATNYRLVALVLLLLGLISFFYAFYLLFFHKSYFGWILATSVSGLFFAQSFKYDFWALQMRRRKLGISFNEWMNALLGSRGK